MNVLDQLPAGSRVLLVRLRSLGDCVLTTPALELLGRYRPDLRIAVVEAQAMQLPVVASDAGGLPENVEDGRTGFIVPRRDPVALADKLAVLATDADLRRRMGAAGRTRVENCFSLPRQIAAFDRFYREMADHHAH